MRFRNLNDELRNGDKDNDIDQESHTSAMSMNWRAQF